jgi:AraC-like DNA-binding protein
MSGRPVGKKRQLKKTFITFLVSYLLVLMVPIIICSVIYINVVQVIREQEKHSHIAMLRQVSYDVETKLQEIFTMATNIAMTQSVQAFLPAKRQMTEDSRYLVFNVINNIQPYRNSNRFVKDFYIYFKNSDIIINSNNMCSPEFYYNNMYHYNDLTFEQWYSGFLQGTHETSFIPTMEVTSLNTKQKMMTFMQPIPITEKINPSAILFMLVEEEKFRNMTSSLSTGGSIHILSKENEIIFESEENNLLDKVDLKAITENDSISYINFDGKNYALTFFKSNKAKLKYVYIAPQSVFLEKANSIQKTVVSYVIICFIVGLVLVYLMAFRCYTPIKQIVQMITTMQENKNTVYENELEFIKKSITRIFNKNTHLQQSYNRINKENEEFIEKFSKNMYSLKNSFVKDLIKGVILDRDIINSLMTFYELQLISDQFVVILFQIDKHTSLENNNLKELHNICRLITSAVELLPNKIVAYTTEIDYDIVGLLVNFESNKHTEKIMGQLVNVSKKIQDCIFEHQKISITVGIGDIQKGVESIPISYKQCIQALNCKIIEGCKKVIVYRDIVSNEVNRQKYFYPIQVEIQLLNSVKAGDVTQCEMLLKNIFNKNKNIDSKLAQCLFYNIICTVLKTLDDIEIKYSEIPGIETNPIDLLFQCESLNDINREVLKLFHVICKYISSKKINRNNELLEQVTNYINENYFIKDLSQTNIADLFSITPQYLSTFFKQNTGQNMVDYINRLRIEKVKELLWNSRLTISEIADKTGFGSIRSLDRVFKNYEGISPGKFREINLKVRDIGNEVATEL